MERDLLWLSELELSEKAMLFFHVNGEALVDEENPENRPLWIVNWQCFTFPDFLLE